MQIVDRPSFTVVGIPVQALRAELGSVLPATWGVFRRRCTEIDARVSAYLIDIVLEQRGDRCTRLLCAEVSRVSHLPDGMTTMDVPNGRYIHHQHAGPVEGIAAAFAAIAEWARANGYGTDAFTLDLGYVPHGADREHDLFVRIR